MPIPSDFSATIRQDAARRHVAAAVRAARARGAFGPREQLDPAAVAETVGVSPADVLEAFELLAADGVVSTDADGVTRVR